MNSRERAREMTLSQMRLDELVPRSCEIQGESLMAGTPAGLTMKQVAS
jgi:hypothetical protein